MDFTINPKEKDREREFIIHDWKMGKDSCKISDSIFLKEDYKSCLEKCEKKCSDYQKHSQNGMKVSLPICACSDAS